MLKFKTVVTTLLALVLIGCVGHLPPREIALNTAITSNKALALVQDVEAQVCWNQSSAPAAKLAGLDLTTCSSPLAAQVGLTTARHQAINRQLDKLFGLHLRMSQDLRIWTAGMPVPVSVKDFADGSSELSGLLHDLTTGSPKIRALLDQVQSLVSASLKIVQALQEAR